MILQVILPIAYCLSPIAYCLLPIAYCLLPIAYCWDTAEEPITCGFAAIGTHLQLLAAAVVAIQCGSQAWR